MPGWTRRSKRLRARYEVEQAQEAIRLYKRDYDATSAELEELARQAKLPPLVDSPPMTRDDQLDYEVRDRAGVPLVVSSFSNMTAATTGVAFRLDGVPEQDLLYVALLPQLLRQVGVIRDGEPVSFEEMSEALKNEILDLRSYFSTNHDTNRCELALRGSGNDRDEARRAVEWMRLVLNHPDWRPENLPRIRDVVDQQLAGLRNRMQRSEESWVTDPAAAYRRQDDPCLLATASFLTRAHYVYRLRWLLKEAGSHGKAVASFLTRLESASSSESREQVEAAAGPPARELREGLATARGARAAPRGIRGSPTAPEHWWTRPSRI